MRVLYMAGRGVSDPTGASVPLHLAANGSVAEGQEVTVVLAGDATDLVPKKTADAVHGVATPPLTELFTKLVEHQVPIYVWKACAVARGVTDEDLDWLNARWAGPPDVARLIAENDRVVSL